VLFQADGSKKLLFLRESKPLPIAFKEIACIKKIILVVNRPVSIVTTKNTAD